MNSYALVTHVLYCIRVRLLHLYLLNLNLLFHFLQATEVTEQGPIFDEHYEENQLLDYNTSKETVEEKSFTGKVDQNREVYETSSAELVDSCSGSFEESSAKLRFRAKRGNVLGSHQKQSLLSLQSSLLPGWISPLFPLSICVILVLIIILLGLWRASDSSAA